MSPALCSRGMLAAIAASGAFAAGALTTPPASADPEQPGVECVRENFGYLCDSPVRPDDTFTRCRFARAVFAAHGLYIPPTRRCWIVNLADPDPAYGFDLPQEHLQA